MAHLQDLPPEVIFQILDGLHPADVYALVQASSHCLRILQANSYLVLPAQIKHVFPHNPEVWHRPEIFHDLDSELFSSGALPVTEVAAMRVWYPHSTVHR
jgi:hypothetical protein